MNLLILNFLAKKGMEEYSPFLPLLILEGASANKKLEVSNEKSSHVIF